MQYRYVRRIPKKKKEGDTTTVRVRVKGKKNKKRKITKHCKRKEMMIVSSHYFFAHHGLVKRWEGKRVGRYLLYIHLNTCLRLAVMDRNHSSFLPDMTTTQSLSKVTVVRASKSLLRAPKRWINTIITCHMVAPGSA